ncbi:MAG: hypothetical protein CHACPFDD_00496 [Phycisphaerae bacterium]|nr:hypothetical protein [Phycisphaerae bacterium]
MNYYGQFGLDRPPFDARVEPDVFFRGPAQEAALATALFVIRARKGVGVIIGEPGCGKTTLLQTVARLIADEVHVLRHPRVGGGQVDVLDDDRWPWATREGDAPARRAVAVLVDGAEHLAPGAIRRIGEIASWISDAPGADATLLLAGGACFETMLGTPQWQRLARRVFRVTHLQPLPATIVPEYVAARLSAAGGGQRPVFSADALALLARVSCGTPGEINRLCDNALIEAYGEGATQVATRHVRAASRHLGETRMVRRDEAAREGLAGSLRFERADRPPAPDGPGASRRAIGLTDDTQRRLTALATRMSRLTAPSCRVELSQSAAGPGRTGAELRLAGAGD